ncbi:MAG: LysR family transcriptional regulator [Eubacteriales bacterium]|nr:LysR family transcriptional regulator [Eubacteriales bacterium]
MNTRQFRYILAIAECGSISRAAEQLYISQSGLNQQLIRIEKELGVSIFERDTHHLKITEAGEIVAAYARESIFQEERMRTQLQDLRDSSVGEIRLNLAMEQGTQLFCAVFPEFHRKYPRISFKLEDHKVYDQYDMLLQKKLDIGMAMITKRELPELEYVHLARERFLLGVPAGHPLAGMYQPTEDGDYPEMDLYLCRDEPFSLMFSGSTMRQAVDPCFREAGFQPQVMFESRMNHVAALMVRGGVCLTILPESQARLYDDIRWFRLASDPFWESCLMYHHENPPRKSGRYFIDLAVSKAGFLSARSKPVWP